MGEWHGVPGTEPAGGTELGEARGAAGDAGAARTDGTRLQAGEWGGGGTAGDGGRRGGQSDTKKPTLGGRVLQDENSICKMDTPQGSLSRSDKESGTERLLVLQGAHPTEGSWELTGLRDPPWRPTSPRGRGQLGEIVEGEVGEDLFGQAIKDMGEGYSTAHPWLLESGLEEDVSPSGEVGVGETDLMGSRAGHKGIVVPSRGGEHLEEGAHHSQERQEA